MAHTLAYAGFGAIYTLITWYFLTIDRETVPEKVGWIYGVLVGGLLASIAGAALAPGGLTVGLLVAGAMPAGLLLWLLPQRRVPDGELIVSVGSQMPVLKAKDETNQPFDLATLRGQRVMVKFFRGSW